MDLEDVNTADQAAQYLKLTTDKLKALARRGEIGHIRAGRSYLFTRAAIEEWLKRNTRALRLPPKPPHGLTEGAWRNIQRGRRR
jgi:excisionase family DNA binding protein